MAEKKIVAEKTFAECSLMSPIKMPRLPILQRKLFTNSFKTSKFAKVFSSKRFPLYGMFELKL